MAEPSQPQSLLGSFMNKPPRHEQKASEGSVNAAPADAKKSIRHLSSSFGSANALAEGIKAGGGINAHMLNMMGTSLASFKIGNEPMEIVYEPESYGKAKEVKKQVDAVLDNLNGLFGHVLEKEAMKMQQKTKPQLNHARQKIIS